jgi:hypothetical protein
MLTLVFRRLQGTQACETRLRGCMVPPSDSSISLTSMMGEKCMGLNPARKKVYSTEDS